MRILHLSTSLDGGAGIFCRRLAEFQVARGHTVSIATRTPRSATGCDVVALDDLMTRTRSKIVTGLNQRIGSDTVQTAFSPLSIGAGVFRVIDQASPDVVHIHNWYNLLADIDFGALNQGFKTVATLHDERMYTGGCHTAGNCDGYVRRCEACPQARRALQRLPSFTHRRILTSVATARTMEFVAPSAWLLDRGRKSSVLAGARLTHIPNGVPAEFQRPKDFPRLLARLRSPQGSWKVGWIPGKGKATFMDYLFTLRECLTPSEAARIRVVTTEGLQEEEVPFLLEQTGRIRSDSCMSNFWSNCDVVISTTRADNFPSAIIEALSVGTPVLGFGVGGSGEAIAATGGGRVFADARVETMAKYTVHVFRRPEELVRLGRLACGAGKLFSMDTCNRRYEALYDK